MCLFFCRLFLHNFRANEFNHATHLIMCCTHELYRVTLLCSLLLSQIKHVRVGGFVTKKKEHNKAQGMLRDLGNSINFVDDGTAYTRSTTSVNDEEPPPFVNNQKIKLGDEGEAEEAQQLLNNTNNSELLVQEAAPTNNTSSSTLVADITPQLEEANPQQINTTNNTNNNTATISDASNNAATIHSDTESATTSSNNRGIYLIYFLLGTFSLFYLMDPSAPFFVQYLIKEKHITLDTVSFFCV